MKKLLLLLSLSVPVFAQTNIQGTNIQIGGSSTGGGLSGQTVNCAPKANSTSTSNASLPVCDDGTTTTISHPLSVTDTGGQNGAVDLKPGAGGPAATANHAIFQNDGSGHATVSEGTTSASRICTATNSSGVTGCGGGGLSGQTTGYLPLAATATTSTSSSHLFENSTTSGVLNYGFLSQKQTPNCKNRGVTFTSKACDEFDYYDDGSAAGTTPRNLTGLNIHGQFWGDSGPGTGEARTSTLFGGTNNGAFVTPGIKLAQVQNISCFGIGDCQGLQLSQAMHSGVAYQSDQGSQLIYAWVGESGHWSGTVAAGGSSIAPKVTSAGGCFAQQDQTCTVTPGWVLIDKSVTRASGKITGACTTSSISWLSTCTTDQTTIPTSAAWGTALSVSINPATTGGWNSPVNVTFTIGAGGGTGAGTFAAGDHACVIGNQFYEERVIASASGSAGAQTITIPLAKPEANVAIFKGDCMFLSQDADATMGIDISLPVVSIDGIHILTGMTAFSTVFPYTGFGVGGQWATYDGGANAGFHLYAGARVDLVTTTRPDFNPFADDAIQITLEPNAAFNVGDSISAPDFPAQKVDGTELTAVQDTPSASYAQLTGLRVNIGGHGANGVAAGMRFRNTEPTTSYQLYGGALTEPAMMTTEGSSVFDSVLNAVNTPASSIFYFNNHQTGQTSYQILRDPSWGIFSIQADGFHFSNDLFGGSYSSTGKVSSTVGLIAGVGDGARNGAGVQYNFGNGTTPPVWWTQCHAQGVTNNHLCATDQGNSRVTGGGDYNVTGNVAIEVGDFTMNGTTPGISYGGYHTIKIYSNGTPTTTPPAALVFTDTTSGIYPLILRTNNLDGQLKGLETPSDSVYGWGSTSTGGSGIDTGLSRDSAGVVDVGNGSPGNTSGTLKAANIVISGSNACRQDGTNCPASSMPLYTTSGTSISTPHMVTFTGTLAANSLTVTLSGSAVFSSSSSYACTADAGAGSATVLIGFTYTSGSSFTVLSDAATPTVRGNCVGN